MNWSTSFRYLLLPFIILLSAFSIYAQDIPCEYRLELFDQAGDGWNGANLILTTDGVSTAYTLNNIDDDGTLANFQITVNDGDSIFVNFTSGAANDEILVSLYDPTGALVLSLDARFVTNDTYLLVAQCPSCPPPPPSSVLPDNIGATSADISFRLPDPEGRYIIEYDTSGFTPGMGANTLVNFSGDTTLTNLAEKTSYDLYLASVCSNGDTSDLVGPFSFETLWAVDVGVSGLVTPMTDCALSSDEEVLVTLENFGANPQSLIPFKYNINGVDASITMPQDGLYTGVLGRDSTDSAFPFDAKWDFSIPQEYIITAWTELEEDRDLMNDTFQLTITNIPFIAEYPYFENFEEWKGGWIPDEEGQNTSWAFGEPGGSILNAAFSGSNAWATNLDGFYNNNELSFLLSPCLDFSAFEEDPSISFFFNFVSEFDFDQAWLESSIDGGETWSKVGQAGDGVNWYNDEETNTWTGAVTEGWAYATDTLSGLAGQPDVRLRFVFLSDGSVSTEGLALDDIYIGTPLENDLVMVNAVNSGEECGDPADQLTILVGNYGQTTQNGFTVSYQVNSGDIITEEITDVELAPGEQLEYTFQASFNSTPIGTYEVRAWTDFEEEILRQNDTTVIVFTNARALPFAEDFEDPNSLEDWTIDDSELTRQHNNTSTVLSDNLWRVDQTLTAVTPSIGPIAMGDSLSFQYRFVDFNFPYDGWPLTTGDTLSVGVSTDCGLTFTTIYEITASNHETTSEMTTVKLSMEDYVGQAVKVRFFAQRRNEGDYFIDIDNVNVFQCRDLELSAEVINASSSEAADGSIRIIPGAGVPPYSFEWSTEALANTATQLTTGDYFVTVTDRLGCSSTLEVRVDIETATEEPAWFQSLSLAPNPTTGTVLLRLPDAPPTDITVEILDMVGHSLRRTPIGLFEGNELEMDLSSYPSGLYLIRIVAGQRMKTVKLVKQ